MNDWTAEQGLDDIAKNHVFGFERPDLYEGKNRAFTFWVKIPTELIVVDKETLEIPSMNYLTTMCPVYTDPFNIIPRTWERLSQWAKQNGFEQALFPCLERHLTGNIVSNFTLELYFPVKS